MTIFQLLVYSCLTVMMPGTTDLLSKACSWEQTGEYFDREGICSAEGARRLGGTVMSDKVYLGAEHKIEKYRCQKLTVRVN